MGTIVVVLDSDTPNEQLLNAAKTYATGTETEVLLCRVVDRDQYEDEVLTKAEARKRGDSIEDIESKAEAEATEIGAEYFGDEVQYESLGVVGTIPEDILEIAEKWDSDHVFTTGKKRSPTGKMLFGDQAQKLVLDFDGPVTIITEPAE
ncbi:universal stress protein [Haloarcula sp. S1AR25-5A]|uniref:Universal stress protein n=1 Tax=Haloarcula terrestris TaxID=2950533 RepID=A0AAE4JHA9_9EURY|nr:universal stress protein [Haloarcula terrestris]MDS0222363.1 universal stress protein [Haloarcula terrestris]